jgi:hypothetical protein
VRVPSEIESKESAGREKIGPSSHLPLFRLCISRFYLVRMRNLGLRAVHDIQLPNANLSSVAIDLEEDVIYVTSERQNADADTEVEVFKLEPQQNESIQVRSFKWVFAAVS